MITDRLSLVEPLLDMATGEGFSPTRLPGVKFMRATRSYAEMKVSYEPSIVIIAQGRKYGHLPDKRFVYDADNYLVLTVPMPFDCSTECREGEPLLGLSIGVTPALVSELALQVGAAPTRERPQAIESARLDGPIRDATARLLQALRSDEEAAVLGPQLVREVAYWALKGPLGYNLRALAAPDNHFGQICRIINRLQADCARPIEVEGLAREAGMSVSTFHAHFKAVTSFSPLQYLKNIRLHRARLLMLHEGLSAAETALRVGYESASQFSREFKRYFGDTPGATVARLREDMLSLA
ncbi:MAG: AraC family transcriptional regulator [Verrucomicrobiota bacterium JB022]|nr:AraC family transcriptional regulator [Verrucomicrobiota bacterium JB022]